MTYIRPTKAEFAAIFTEFADVPDAQFNYWIDQAEQVIGPEFGDSQLHGTQLLTAHYLAMEGLGSGINSQRSGDFGGATNVKSGTLQLGWSDGATDTGSSRGSTGTRYGDEVRALIIAVKGGPKVTRTGFFPPRVNRGGFYGYS